MAIRVLVVDDSPLMRKLLCEIVNSALNLEVVGTASDPLEARELIKALNPDVLTLDVEMPKMDGLTFLERLMRLRPMPVVMISTLTAAGSETTLQALELGAVDFVSKPRCDPSRGLTAYAEDICEKIRAAHGARLDRCGAISRSRAQTCARDRVVAARAAAPLGNARTAAERLILIGASTGGTEAIKEVLVGLPADAPGVLIVQHMPEMFTGSFARRLDSVCQIRVKEAEDGDRVRPGHAYLAPGHSHLLVRRGGCAYICELSKADPVNRHRPSVDVLFSSAARQAGRHATGVILTGMGKDGAQGLLEMRSAGAYTLAQDQASCVVFGMPREAVAIGAAEEVVGLTDIAPRVLSRLRN
jgi:two-component system chemotaxis response regulator CheB